MATEALSSNMANMSLANAGGNSNVSDALALSPGNGSANPNSLASTAASQLGQVKQLLDQPAVKKAMPALLLAIMLLIFGLAYTWINAPTYRQIAVGITEADQQAAFDALKTADFKPVLDSSTGQVTVPTTRYHEARIFLAAKGLPKTAPSGMDALKDQSAMTTSQFMEQARYNQAMEQELARSILQIDSIQSARVHLAMPKQSAFVRDRTPPKASVVLTPFPGRVLSQTQVQAVVNLVASSIPMLSADNVSVVDNHGKLLTDNQTQSNLGMTAAQTQHKEKMEESLRQRIDEILTPITGDANVRAQVNMTLDFTETEMTTENFDPSEKGAKTRSEVLSEERNTAKEAGGIPGTLSNTPPPAPSASTNTTAANPTQDEKTVNNSHTTRNYELDRLVKHVKGATGTVQRLSVAVVINERAPIPQPKNDKGEAQDPKPNPYTPEEIEHLQSLVRSVVGFNEARGDVVTVIPAKFEPEQVVDMRLPWYKDDAVMNLIKSGFLGLVFIAFLLLVVKPAVGHVLNRDKEIAEAVAAAMPATQPADGELSADDMNAIQLGDGETLEQMKAKLKPKKSSISMEMLDTANSYDDKVALVRLLVAEDSGRVASVLKNMIKTA